MTWGRRSGRGLAPLRSVGASIHWPEAMSAGTEHPTRPRASQPLAAIQRAPGATPMAVPPASPPTMVPTVWVPWPWLSHGSSVGHTRDGSNQL